MHTGFFVGEWLARCDGASLSGHKVGISSAEGIERSKMGPAEDQTLENTVIGYSGTLTSSDSPGLRLKARQCLEMSQNAHMNSFKIVGNWRGTLFYLPVHTYPHLHVGTSMS